MSDQNDALMEEMAHEIEIARLQRRHLIEVMALVNAAGGRIRVSPKDLHNLMQMELITEQDPKIGGSVYMVRLRQN